MKKKIILFSLLASLIIGMTACNNENSVPEVTEQTILISETVSEKAETTSQSETGTEKTETAETSEEAKTTLTVNDVTQVTVKEENTMAIVTDETSDQSKSESVFEKLTLTLNNKQYSFPLSLDTLGEDYSYDTEYYVDNKPDKNGLYKITTDLMYKNIRYIGVGVESEDEILSKTDKIKYISVVDNVINDLSFKINDFTFGETKENIIKFYGKPNRDDQDGKILYGNTSEFLILSFDEENKLYLISILI